MQYNSQHGFIKQLTQHCLNFISFVSQGDLVCFQRNGFTGVPGCAGEGSSGYDYCYKHYPTYGPLVLIGDGYTGLKVCEGDCDSDSDCEGDLLCYQRGDGPVPGCEGGVGEFPTEDFCYDPTQGMPGVVPPATWVPVIAEDFDGGEVISDVGGKNADITNKESHGGGGSLSLKAANGALGVSDEFPVGDYQEAKIDFWYLFKGDTRPGDNFVLEWSSNNGNTWTEPELETYTREDVVDTWIHSTAIIWSLNNASSLRIRFKSNMYSGKKVYIDDVTLVAR